MPIYGLLLIVGAYLIGAIPFGLLIGLARGVDIRRHGSHNIGATNAGRVLGRRWGYLCLLLDVLKGFGPTLAASFVLVSEPVGVGGLSLWILVGVAAVLGHTMPVYLKFRGGKGVATTVGVALGIFPYYTVAMGVALVLYAAVRFSTGLVSAGSLTIAVAFPLAFFVYLGVDDEMSLAVFWPLAAVSVVLGGLIVLRHRSNIGRLLRGEEPRAGSGDPNPSRDTAENEL